MLHTREDPQCPLMQGLLGNCLIGYERTQVQLGLGELGKFRYFLSSFAESLFNFSPISFLPMDRVPPPRLSFLLVHDLVQTGCHFPLPQTLRIHSQANYQYKKRAWLLTSLNHFQRNLS